MVSKVQVSGNVDITDHVSTSVPVEIASDMSGTLTIRPDCDYAKKDAVIVKPVGKYLDSDKLKNITLVNNDFYLDYKNNTFYLSDTAPLVNTSIFSGKNFCVGDSIKIYPSAHGGNGKYTYQYLLETFDENGIEIPLDADSDKEVYEFTFKEKGLYGFTVVVRDSAGKVAYSNQNICTVYDKLVNNSTVSATSVTLGNSVTLKGSATGGASGYQYAVYYKKKSDKSWTKVQDYKSTVDSKVTPKYATDYIIRVKAKDKLGNIANRDLSVKVNEKLANASKISASSIDIGQSVTVTASAKGGVSPLTYAVLYKKTSDSKWTTKQGFKANATVSIKPESATTYDICVKVKDSQGTIEKKFFTLTVNKGLENKSTISASTIKQGSSVTVKCSASGGSGYYNYAVFYKKESDSKWTTKQNFSSNSNVSVTPQKATTYDICVKVRDNADRETKKYFKLTVTNAELSNNSKISAETVKVNGTVKITGVATGGTSPYTYAFYYKDMNGSAWTEKQNFSSNSAVSVKFTKSGVYNICAKIKDNKGTVAKKYFTVTVEK